MACEQANKSKQAIIKGQDQELELQVKRIAELEASQGSSLMDGVIYFIVGAAAASLTIAILKR